MFALLLLAAAMFGLLAVQTSAAAAAVPTASLPQAATMSADCMEMMGEHPAQPEKKPCNGLTLDCIFAMGCAVPLTRESPIPAARALVTEPLLFWSSPTELSGAVPVPPTPPPTTLA